MATKWRLEEIDKNFLKSVCSIGGIASILLNAMTQELKLHSPAGAEAIVYNWPLQKSVSFPCQFSCNVINTVTALNVFC